MQCNPKDRHLPLPPKLQALEEIGKIIHRHGDQCFNAYEPLRKLVLTDLILNHAQLTTVDIQAKEIEASAYIERLNSVLIEFKADIDRLPINVLKNIALASGVSEDFAREWVPKQVDKTTQYYNSVKDALENMKCAFEVGKKDWPELKMRMVKKHGLEILVKNGLEE